MLISELARVIARAEGARLLPGTLPLPAARAAAMDTARMAFAPSLPLLLVPSSAIIARSIST